MKQTANYLRQNVRTMGLLLLGFIAIVGLMLWRLGTVTHGMSTSEVVTAHATYGIHGIEQQPLYLPLDVLRSLVFTVTSHRSSLIVRLPNVVFGILTISLFAHIVDRWHGKRTALLATILLATGAWTLHISRLASNDALYLVALPLLFVSQYYMHRASNRAIVWYGNLALLGIMLYIPGLPWFVLLSVYWQRAGIYNGWLVFKLWWQRALYVLLGLVWLPLLITKTLSTGNTAKIWLGLPTRFVFKTIARQLAVVPIHLFVRGPYDTERWLGHTPILDAFTLLAALTGIYFYALHWKATRSHLLASYFLLGVILVGLGGAVTLSLLVPLLYIFAATGIAFLLHEWLKVFPRNPLARALGIGLITIAVVVSASYNLRAYFVAWPHDADTLTTFVQQP